MESWITKMCALGLLLLFTLLFGLIPIQVIKALQRTRQAGRGLTRSKVEFWLSLLNCFAGGVFLGTTLLHLMPEVREDMEGVLEGYGVKTDFAVAEFTIAGGFFIIMVVENVVMVLQHHPSGGGGMESMESSVCCDNDSQEEKLIKKTDKNKRPRSYGSIGDVGQFDNNSIHLSHEGAHLSASQQLTMAQVEKGTPGGEGHRHQPGGSTSGGDSHGHGAGPSSHDNHGHHHHHHGHHHHHQHHLVVEVSPEGEHHRPHQHQDTEQPHPGGGCESMHPPIKVEKGDCVHVIHPSHHEHHHMQVQKLASLRSFLLLLALSLHTVFEGLAIGLQPTNEAVWNLFAAIVVHKSIIAFSMGIQFAETLTTFRRATVFIVLFALMSPLGVAVGTGVFELQGSNSGSMLASVILQAIAAGTFLYVTFFEVLNKEVGQDHSLLKVLFIVLGFGVMVLLNLFNHEPK